MSLEQKQLEKLFFESPVRNDGEVFGAPSEALLHRDRLKLKYFAKDATGLGYAVSVNLRPQYKEEPQGWIVEAVVIKKPSVVYLSIGSELVN